MNAHHELWAPTDDTWRRTAACLGRHDINWFPAPGESLTPAVAVCAGCPVVTECLADALEEPDTGGVRGGMSKRRRHRIRKSVNLHTRCRRCGTAMVREFRGQPGRPPVICTECRRQ